mmetsp:Transcript_3382/g.4330  ORF Transcript_3382/g.4330 Transcript_3382/m.4330 type:complete len:203 (-) Transcript_3382:244-852(-)
MVDSVCREKFNPITKGLFTATSALLSLIANLSACLDLIRFLSMAFMAYSLPDANRLQTVTRPYPPRPSSLISQKSPFTTLRSTYHKRLLARSYSSLFKKSPQYCFFKLSNTTTSNSSNRAVGSSSETSFSSIFTFDDNWDELISKAFHIHDNGDGLISNDFHIHDMGDKSVSNGIEFTYSMQLYTLLPNKPTTQQFSPQMGS